MIDGEEEVQVDSAPVKASDEELCSSAHGDRYRGMAAGMAGSAGPSQDPHALISAEIRGTPKTRARQDAGRPCYRTTRLQPVRFPVRQLRSPVRSAALRSSPKAAQGIPEDAAELRQDIARTIEYQSKAQSVYLKGYQDEVEGGYGFCRVSRRYVDDESE